MDLSSFNQFTSHAVLRCARAVGQDRKVLIRVWAFSALFTAALHAAGGCASTPALPPSEEVRGSLGYIGIRSGSASPSDEWSMPAKGGWVGAGRGAAVGALSVLSAPCAGYGCAANIVLAPVGAVVGSIVGATTAETQSAVEEAEAAIRAAFAGLKIPTTLRNQIEQVARTETRHTLVLEDDMTEACAMEENPTRCTDAIDTVLRINIQGYGTKAAWRPNPPVFLFLDTDVRLMRRADGTVIYSRKVAWMSAGRPLVAWAAGNGNPVRQELERGIQYLAERIVDVVFLVRSVP